ncbi:MAG: hypothetical protein QOE90_2346 [Thermoplasmata archaeon]|nr:hypothetical protein [Thermoplasmata archaeon]
MIGAAKPRLARRARRPRRRKGRRWPFVLLTVAYAGALKDAKPSPYHHVWDEEPGARSWAGEQYRSVEGLDWSDAEFWIAVLLAMPFSMQAYFFSLRTSAQRAAWFAVARADHSQAPAFLQARSLYLSERSRQVRYVRRVPPPLAGVSLDG